MSAEGEKGPSLGEFPQLTNFNAVANNLKIARNGMLKSMGTCMELIRDNYGKSSLLVSVACSRIAEAATCLLLLKEVPHFAFVEDITRVGKYEEQLSVAVRIHEHLVDTNIPTSILASLEDLRIMGNLETRDYGDERTLSDADQARLPEMLIPLGKFMLKHQGVKVRSNIRRSNSSSEQQMPDLPRPIPIRPKIAKKSSVVPLLPAIEAEEEKRTLVKTITTTVEDDGSMAHGSSHQQPPVLPPSDTQGKGKKGKKASVPGTAPQHQQQQQQQQQQQHHGERLAKSESMPHIPHATAHVGGGSNNSTSNNSHSLSTGKSNEALRGSLSNQASPTKKPDAGIAAASGKNNAAPLLQHQSSNQAVIQPVPNGVSLTLKDGKRDLRGFERPFRGPPRYPAEQQCKSWLTGKCPRGDKCPLKHADKCFNNNRGGCDNLGCPCVHVALCSLPDCNDPLRCTFDHLGKQDLRQRSQAQVSSI